MDETPVEKEVRSPEEKPKTKKSARKQLPKPDLPKVVEDTSNKSNPIEKDCKRQENEENKKAKTSEPELTFEEEWLLSGGGSGGGGGSEGGGGGGGKSGDLKADGDLPAEGEVPVVAVLQWWLCCS